ncbi:hypothetical protein K493DRAFT_334374 [Basidiobolus meristosporus CBS 931.73]|uniref:Programmed cell death protein 2 C-terminal domain-containing protein n=1 Tax=Basidiobolus meristosporus CBS 931.73 TaxID=1314790 RepID=A0A1Y1YYH6_9FUNG|nr:hypothetical protein K493DRAFT_334374 [Basidiobolus meristosporus CBS 931.73]|eukprot:ORY03098.1 hypothetical protein K493DRAFT_334374 [Basidiobolus meristosporus CBS 931.73]
MSNANKASSTPKKPNQAKTPLDTPNKSVKSNRTKTQTPKGKQKEHKKEKPKQPTLLGFPDGALPESLDTDAYTTKIGGRPVWLDSSSPAPVDTAVCQCCKDPMFLLLQAYVPLDWSAFHRVMYVWGCNKRKCMQKPGSFRVFRGHLVDESYIQKLKQKEAKKNKAKPAAAAPSNIGSMIFGGGFGSFDNPFSADAELPNIEELKISDPPSVEADHEAQSVEESSQTDTAPSASAESNAWFKSIPAFPAQYLYIDEEVLEDPSAKIDLSKYSKYLVQEDLDEEGEDAGTWQGETYEKSWKPKGYDKAFKRFTEVVSEYPEQCVRYEFSGNPLLYTNRDTVAGLLTSGNPKSLNYSSHKVPKCPHCSSERVFEFQLMPNILSELPTEKFSENSPFNLDLNQEEMRKLGDGVIHKFDLGMEWGTIMVFSCGKDCHGGVTDVDTTSTDLGYYEEVALVQYEN